MMDIFIPHEIRPFEAKDSSQAPPIQRVNSKYVRFVDTDRKNKTRNTYGNIYLPQE